MIKILDLTFSSCVIDSVASRLPWHLKTAFVVVTTQEPLTRVVAGSPQQRPSEGTEAGHIIKSPHRPQPGRL